MMKYYQDVTLLPQPEIPLFFLWEKVYQQVHLALVEIQDGKGQVDVGVAFPGYDAGQFQLGCKLRFFAAEKELLENLAVNKWLSRLVDYINITGICDVPIDCKYAVFRRLRPKSSNARMARRKAKREGITLEQAIQALGGRKEQFTKLPYIWSTSLSSDKRYRLFIDYEKVDQGCAGKFSTYGLSHQTTVPVF